MKAKLSRLIVLFFIIAIPSYIAYNFWAYNFQVAWLPISWQESSFIQALVKYVSPIIFCIAWIYLMVKLATLISDSIDLMVEKSSFISPHYLFFFGMNALVLFYIFLIPLITPIMSIIAYASMIFTLLTSKVDYESLDIKTRKAVKRITAVAVLPAIFCSILIIPESLEISIELWNEFWNNYVEDLFYFIKALGVALSIGAFVSIYKKGVAEAETGRKVTEIEPTPGLYLGEILMVVFMVFLNYRDIDFVNLLYYLSPIFSGLTFVINIVKGRKNLDSNYGNPFGIFIWLMFMITILLFRRYPVLRFWTVLISAILFTIYFFAFMNHPAHEEK